MEEARGRLTRGRLWIALVVIVLVTVGLGAWVVAPLLRAQPGKSVDYRQKLVDHVGALQPEGENAWDDYLRVIELHESLQREIREQAPELAKLVHPEYWTVYQGPDAPPAPTGDEQIDALNAEDAANAAADHAVAREWAIKTLEQFPSKGIDDALDIVVKSTRAVRPKCDGVLMNELTEDLGAARGLARALRARVWLAGERGDEAMVVADVERLLAIARVAGSQGSLIERLVGIAMMANTVGVVRERVMLKRFSEDTLLALMEGIEKRAVLPALSTAMEAERIKMLDYVQETYTDDGNGDGVRLLTRMNEIADERVGKAPRRHNPLLNLSGLTHPSKKKMVAKLNEMYDGLAKAADAPRGDRAAAFDAAEYESRLTKKFEILALLLSAYSNTVNSWDQIRMDLAGTRLMLAIEVHRARHGEPPAALEDLVPGVIPALPIDVYSPDGTFGYRVLEEANEDGQVYLLYSVGADGRDNGGQPARLRFDALRDAGKGTDFIINTND